MSAFGSLPPPAASSAFGAPPPASSAFGVPPPAAVSAFGAPPPAAVSAFGAPPPAAASAFGAPPPASSAFGAPPPAAVSAFGAPPPAATSAFGAPPPAAASAFGVPAFGVAPPPAPTGFGAFGPPVGSTTFACAVGFGTVDPIAEFNENFIEATSTLLRDAYGCVIRQLQTPDINEAQAAAAMAVTLNKMWHHMLRAKPTDDVGSVGMNIKCMLHIASLPDVLCLMHQAGTAALGASFSKELQKFSQPLAAPGMVAALILSGRGGVGKGMVDAIKETTQKRLTAWLASHGPKAPRPSVAAGPTLDALREGYKAFHATDKPAAAASGSGGERSIYEALFDVDILG